MVMFLLTFLYFLHFTLSPVRNTLEMSPQSTSESGGTPFVLYTVSTQIHTECTECSYIIGLSRGTNKVRDKSLKPVSQTHGHLFVNGLSSITVLA